ncbi:ribonuclease H family protein [Rhizobium sp.]
MRATDALPTVDTARGIHIFADGCFEPRGRTGGWAFVVFRDGQEVAAQCGRVENTANNAMELDALLRAAQWMDINAPGEPSILWSDSVYVVNGCNHWRPIWKNRSWRKASPGGHGRSRPIADRELWIAVDAILTANPLLQVIWCKGHSGIRGNERSDMLAEHGRLGYGPV